MREGGTDEYAGWKKLFKVPWTCTVATWMVVFMHVYFVWHDFVSYRKLKEKLNTTKKRQWICMQRTQTFPILHASGISQVHIIFGIYCPNLRKLLFYGGNGRKIEWVLNCLCVLIAGCVRLLGSASYKMFYGWEYRLITFLFVISWLK